MSQIFSITKPADEIFLNFPPNIQGDKKQFIYDLALESIAPSSENVVISRWSAMMPTDERSIDSPPISLNCQEGFFDYKEFGLTDQLKVEWHLNFADSQLFIAYGSCLFVRTPV
jgi:hypothetical protein